MLLWFQNHKMRMGHQMKIDDTMKFVYTYSYFRCSLFRWRLHRVYRHRFPTPNCHKISKQLSIQSNYQQPITQRKIQRSRTTIKVKYHPMAIYISFRFERLCVCVYACVSECLLIHGYRFFSRAIAQFPFGFSEIFQYGCVSVCVCTV